MLLIVGEDHARVKPLLSHLRALDVPHRFIHAGQSYMPTTMSWNGVTLCYNRTSPSAAQRGNKDAFAFARIVLSTLHTHQIPILNDDASITLESSKSIQATVCPRFGLHVPRTFTVHGRTALMQLAKRLKIGSSPSAGWYLKPDCGGSSYAVARCTSTHDLDRAYRALPSPLCVLQEEKGVTHNGSNTAERIVWRVELVDSKIVYCSKIKSSEAVQNCCPCILGAKTRQVTARQVPLPDSFRDFVERCTALAKHFHVFTMAVEFVVENDVQFVIDINVNTNYLPADGSAVDGYKVLATTLRNKLLDIN